LELDYNSLARFPGTLVFYMGMTTSRQWSEALLRGGRSPDTPVAIVRRASWPDQETIRCTLAAMADLIERQGIRPPAVIVVGEVVALAPRKPLQPG
jgi:uroporphyrinogen III methyltransferase/synthase